MAAAKKTNRDNRSRKPKAKKPRQPTFKHAVILEVAENGVTSIRSTVPGMTVIVLDHDAPDGFADFNASGSICQRIVMKADRAKRGAVRYLLGAGDPMPEEEDNG